jgi:hypothetical protein
MIFISLIHLAREEKASLRGLKIMFLWKEISYVSIKVLFPALIWFLFII